LLLITSIVFILVLSAGDIAVGRSLGSDLNLSEKIILLIVLILDFLLLNGLIDGQLRLFKSQSVSMLFASQALLEVKLDLRGTHSLVKYLVWEGAGQLLEALIG